MKDVEQSNVLQGRPLSGGLAQGKAFVCRDILQWEHDLFEIEESEVDDEFARIEQALQVVSEDLEATEHRFTASLDSENATIFGAQRAILEDPQLIADLGTSLARRLVNAEQVVRAVFRRWERRLDSTDDVVVRRKGSDLRDLCRRTLHALARSLRHPLEKVPQGSILVAKWLLPSDTVALSRQGVLGVVLEIGGAASHVALLTRELGIACVAGITDIFGKIDNGEQLLVDGYDGSVIPKPTDNDRKEFLYRIERQEALLVKARALRREPAVTLDDEPVSVLANVSGQEDAIHAVENGADGIGLFRTEGIYFAAKRLPTSEELCGSLGAAFSVAKGRPIVVRLLDIGGDKELPYLDAAEERNPFLGLRGIRLLLAYPDLLREQLEAFVRLSQEYDVRILVPMVTVVEDLLAVRAMLEEVCSAMGNERMPLLGAMIETPCAALCADRMAERADFFSVGTNDLTQYAMAAGRDNPLVNQYFVDDHPAILELLSMVLQKVGSKPVTLCGELAGRVETIPTVLKLGLRSLSVAAPLVPVVKQRIRQSEL
ncbi:MAG TPA: phosphoenolpyruvate--protein phosphotransferase [Candidatus Hydrogenedentes bacterium]|nr:phosphoenolpyruvate--protein phosphotransferase [Candidatus Hydrogenedentota bacterium]